MKTAILITARLKSTRLPKKVTKPIQGRPMICHMIDRLRLARRPEQIILCTSTLADDDPLATIAEQQGVACFRGDPDDVLLRLTNAAEEYGVEAVVNCTADNPFVDPIYIDRLADFLIDNRFDYATTEGGGLPLGAYAWAIARPAMVQACRIKAERNTEIWPVYFTTTGKFRWGCLKADEDVRWPELRLTVDTPADFELVTRIFDELYEPGKVFSLAAIVGLCRRHPELAAINAEVEQVAAPPAKLSNSISQL